jgi:hypothetical protein
VDFDPPAFVRVSGTIDRMEELPSVDGFILDDHGQSVLEDDLGEVTGYVISDDVITAIRALNLEVEVLLTSEEVDAEAAEIAAEQGGDVTVPGDVFIALVPPTSEPVPDDFNLTLTPSTGTPQVFEKGDATDLGDGLLSFKVTDPQPGVLYSATVTLEAGGPAVTLFEGFELHALLLEQVQPDRPATPPPFEDPFVFVTDTEDPDADSEPELEVDDDIAAYWESQRRDFVFG